MSDSIIYAALIHQWKNIMIKSFRLTASITALILAMPLSAQTPDPNDPQYVDDTNQNITRTNTRADIYEQGATVGDMTAPSYNPNALRAAGDGLGLHRATQDVEMQGNQILGPSRIVGDGTLQLLGTAQIEITDLPTEDTDAANKFYVDNALAALESDLSTRIDENGENLETVNNDIPDIYEVLTSGNNARGVIVRNIGTPVFGVDAANKDYVDAMIAALRAELTGDGPVDDGNPVTFADLDPVILRQVIYTDPIDVVNTPVSGTLSITGDGDPEFRINNGSWITSGTITNGDTVEARLTTGSNYAQTFTASLSFDGVPFSDWSVTTGDSCQNDLVGMQCPDGTAYAGRLSTGERWYIENNLQDGSILRAFQSAPPYDQDPGRQTSSGYANTYNADSRFNAASYCKSKGSTWFLPSFEDFFNVYGSSGTFRSGLGVDRFEGRQDGNFDLGLSSALGGLGASETDAINEARNRYWTSNEVASVNESNNTAERAYVIHKQSDDEYRIIPGTYVSGIPRRSRPNKDYLMRVRCGRVDSGVTPSLVAPPARTDLE